MSFKDEIKERLAQFAPEYSVAFAARAGLRCLPALASREKQATFWYWPNASRPKYLLDELYALRFSFVSPGLGQIRPKIMISSTEVYEFEQAGFDAAYTSNGVDAELVDQAEHAIHVIAAAANTAHAVNEGGSVGDLSGGVVHAAAAAVEMENSIDEEFRSLDNHLALLTFLQQPLFPGDVPITWVGNIDRFYRWAKTLDAGFEHWLDWYQDRIDGKKIDWDFGSKVD